MEREKRTYQLGIGLIWALHSVGLLGLFWSPMNEWLSQLTPFSTFLSLTPLNLLVTGGLLLYFQKEWNRAAIGWVVASMLIGFGIEVLGVHTGAVFGSYAYGPVLGWKLWEVPLLIGVNWMVLTYASGTILHQLSVGVYAKASIMATVLTCTDLLIEPVAIYWDFWRWEGGIVPVQNYIAWWLVAWVLSWGWLRTFKQIDNSAAIHIFFAQILFFAVNNILILL